MVHKTSPEPVFGILFGQFNLTRGNAREINPGKDIFLLIASATFSP